MYTSENLPSESSGFSFLEESLEYDQIIGDQLAPSEADSKIYANVNEVLAHEGFDISSQDEYIPYLERQFAIRQNKEIPIPHKAWIQLIMTKLGINEPVTRIIPTDDFSTVLKYTMNLLAQGHTEIWWGTADIDDHSDPQGKQNINPPLYKHIRNFRDVLLNIACAVDFAKDHPNSFLKVFPQDGPKPAIGSLVVVENSTGGQWFHLKIRKGEYTTSERKAGDDKPITISIDYTNYPLRVYTNQSTSETMYWLQIILKSHSHFEKLDGSNLIGSDYINPEFLIFQNGPDTKINFFTDIIWGSKIRQLANHKCPKMTQALATINTAISKGEYLIIPDEQSNIIDSANGYMFAVLQTIKSARTHQVDQQTAQLLLKLRSLTSKHLPYVLPELSTRIIKQLQLLALGLRGNELEETIMDLENMLKI
ncbi:hypothetical protein COT87_01735 [Candidatus Collierbacteria bacterium CG10_big_fil_rev_8_21_14_0_10_44_9]|uniref:Uncharacterized protein n=1 Tax=Candidatus Collierbacteria bacterium CG10_big_fil_rev_8_21_14_0_10_44_9 TaxID=1974535 RepID=A0A2H0VIT1_9BACT|nr:MAG: hypothetical protein COT87_01735 [Candidatus Collierbacteria bacterium CG10_big_fil_rev_8_21_14_0_10_44_9]